MNQITDAYAKALIDLNIPAEDIDEAEQCLRSCQELADALSNPVISHAEKDRVIEKLFPSSLFSFFKVLCRNERADEAIEIFRSYRSLNRRAQHCIKATVEYVTPLTESQKERMTELVKRKTGYDKVELCLVENKKLMGGFVLRSGDFRYDRSTVKAISELKKSLIRKDAGELHSRNRKSVRRIRATVEYVTPLTEDQKERIIELVKKKTGYKEVELNLVENKELIGGFVLRAGNLRYDRSAAREVTEMRRELMRR